MCAHIHRRSLGHIQTCKSGPKVAVLQAQNHRWGVVPIEICDFGAKHAVLFAQINRWGLGPTETSNSGGRHAVLHYWPYSVLIELNRAWVRALLALPSPYWANLGLGESLIGNTQSLLSLIRPGWEPYWPYPVLTELNKAWVRALLALPSPNKAWVNALLS